MVVCFNQDPWVYVSKDLNGRGRGRSTKRLFCPRNPYIRSWNFWGSAVPFPQIVVLRSLNVQLSMSGGITMFCFDNNILTRIFRIFVEFELSSPPIDSVSQLRFSPKNPDHLLVAAWDAVRAWLAVILVFKTYHTYNTDSTILRCRG